MKYDNIPIASFSGPRGAHIDCSKGWNNLKQNPSFLLGRSMTWHVLSTVLNGYSVIKI